MTDVAPYESLAAIYDHVMRHVDYRHWARHVDGLLTEYAPDTDTDTDTNTVVELACGTGNATFALADLGRSICGFDGCAAMVEQARLKSAQDGRGIEFDVRDLRDLHGVGPSGAVICLYDSLNYLLEPGDVDEALGQVHEVLIPGGVFIFDVCTEQNSVLHFDGLVDEESGPGFRYTRRSDYHRGDRLQINAFDIEFDDGQRHQETHVQHIYPLQTLHERVLASPLEPVATLDGFSQRPGSEHSDRVHFVVRRPR